MGKSELKGFLRQRRLFGWGGSVIAVIGLVTLPDDLATWGQRIGDVIQAVKNNPVSGLAVLIGVILLVIANWENLSRLRGAKRWHSDEELGNELNGWLRRAGYQLQDIPSEEIARQGVTTTFGFVANDTKGRPVAIIRIVDEPGILLQSRVILTDEKNHRQIVRDMSNEQRSALLEDVGLELARSGLAFNATDLLGEGIIISNVIIPSESMTVYEFLAQVNLVARAILVVQLLVTRHIRLAHAATPIMITTTIPPQLLGSQDPAVTS